MWHIYPSEHPKSTACSCNSWQRCLLLQFWQCCQESLFETPSLIKYLEFSLSPIQHFLLVIIGIFLLSCQCQKSAASETNGTGASTSCYMKDRELKCFDARESVARGNNCQIIISQDYMKPVTLSHGYCSWDSQLDLCKCERDWERRAGKGRWWLVLKKCSSIYCHSWKPWVWVYLVWTVLLKPEIPKPW